MIFKKFLNKETRKEKTKGEIIKRQEEIKQLKEKIKWIEIVLTETKLSDFLLYLRKTRKRLLELKNEVNSLEDRPSFSEKIVSEARIGVEINVLLKDIEKLEEGIKISP